MSIVRRYLWGLAGSSLKPVACSREGNVPVFVDEKVDDVECVQNVNDHHRVRDVPMQLFLVCHKREVTTHPVSKHPPCLPPPVISHLHQSPRYNPRPSIMKQLKIKPLSNPGVELDAHVVIIDDAPRKLQIVRMCRRDSRLHVRPCRKKVSVDIKRDYQPLPILRNPSGVQQICIHRADVESVRNRPRCESINAVRE